MKKKNTVTGEIKQRVKEVKMDNADMKKEKEGVSCKKVSEDTKLINPDMGTLDRGWYCDVLTTPGPDPNYVMNGWKPLGFSAIHDI